MVVWKEHTADEVVWRVTGVEKETSDEMVMKDLLDDVTAVVGSGLVHDSWVDDRRSRYVVVKSIPEAEWVKDGLSKLKGGAGEGGWGRRAPVVVGRIGKPGAERVSVKVEVLSGEVAAALVKNAAVFLGLRKVVELALRGGRSASPSSGGMGAPSVRGCFGCGDRGHVQRFCPTMVMGGLYGGVLGRCWGCGGLGHRMSVCLWDALPVAGPDGTFPPVANGWTVKHGGGVLAVGPLGKGGAIRGGSVLGYMGGSPAPAGGAPWVRIKMLTLELSISDGGGGELRAVEEGEIQGMYMNVGGSVDAMHEFLEHCARENVVISFVGECWVEKK